MKTALHVLAVVAWLVWAGSVLLDDLGRAFGNASSDMMHGEVGVAAIVVVAAVVVASIVASRRAEGRRAWALAALPFAAILLASLLLRVRIRSAAHARHEESRSRARIAQERFDAIHADFRHEGFGEGSEILASILVIDDATRTVVRVDRGEESIDAFCVGGLEGTTLELWGELSVDGYVDDQGHRADERFTVVRGERPEGRACADERYGL